MILNDYDLWRIQTKTLALVCSCIPVSLLCRSGFVIQSLKRKSSSAWCVKTIYFWSVRGPEVSCLDRLRKEEEKRLAEEERLRRAEEEKRLAEERKREEEEQACIAVEERQRMELEEQQRQAELQKEVSWQSPCTETPIELLCLNNWLLAHSMAARGGWSTGRRGSREAASGERTHYATEPTGADGEKEGKHQRHHMTLTFTQFEFKVAAVV